MRNRVCILIFVVWSFGSQLVFAQPPEKRAQFYFFTNAACGPCRLVEPEMEKLYVDGYPVMKIDTAIHPDWTRRFQIEKTPTVVLVQGNQILGKRTGFVKADELRRWFDNSIANEKSQDRSDSPEGLKLPKTYLKGTKSARTVAERRAMNATVRLKIDDPLGSSYATGTIIHSIDGESLVLTCGHVFRESKGEGKISAEFGFLDSNQKTMQVPGELIYFDSEARDIALVAISTGRFIEPVPVAAPQIAFSKGSNIFSIGCDQGDCPSIRHTFLKNTAKYDGVEKFEIFGRPVNGRSGGGLFTKEGQLIGVCNAAVVDVDEGVYASLETVHWQLAEANLVHLFESKNTSMDSDDRPQFADDSEIIRNQNRNLNVIPVRDSFARNSIDRTNPNAVSVNPVALSSESISAENDTEIIVVIRNRSNPTQNESWTLMNPTADLISQLRSAALPQQKKLERQRLAQLRREMPDLPQATGKNYNSQMRAQSKY